MKPLLIGVNRRAEALITALARFNGERGQTIAGYAILGGVIAIVVVAAAVLLDSSVTGLLRSTGSHL